MKGKRVKVILNPDRQKDRRILDYLYYAGMPNSKAIKVAVLAYLDGEDDGNDQFLQKVKEAVRESVQDLRLAPANGGSLSVSAEMDDEEPVSMLDFLDALEKGAAFEESGPPFSP